MITVSMLHGQSCLPRPHKFLLCLGLATFLAKVRNSIELGAIPGSGSMKKPTERGPSWILGPRWNSQMGRGLLNWQLSHCGQ